LTNEDFVGRIEITIIIQVIQWRCDSEIKNACIKNCQHIKKEDHLHSSLAYTFGGSLREKKQVYIQVIQEKWQKR
jgi:hypothetical protein